jgi:hypothetical protein
MTGYEVTNLAETLTKAKAAGVDVVVPPYKTDERDAVVVSFREDTSLRSTQSRRSRTHNRRDGRGNAAHRL